MASELFFGNSEAMQSVSRLAAKVAGTLLPVHIEGEIGVGKKTLARAIHFWSMRNAQEFALVPCSPASELDKFDRMIRFGPESLAGGLRRGSIVLDHVSELDLGRQAKLVPFVEESAATFQIISTTAIPLDVLVADGAFRPNLYHRLNVVHIHIPALRDRRSDIPLLAHQIAGRLAPLSSQIPVLAEETLRQFTERDWPGNLLELEAAVRRDLAMNRPAPHAKRQFGRRSRERPGTKRGPNTYRGFLAS